MNRYRILTMLILAGLLFPARVVPAQGIGEEKERVDRASHASSASLGLTTRSLDQHVLSALGQPDRLLVYQMLSGPIPSSVPLRLQEASRIISSYLLPAQRSIAKEDTPRTHLRWGKVLEQANSDSEQHWRLAILEADIMLNELLDLKGYKGETMADKLKQVERADFNSIDDAWEAHKIRNTIAHEGASFQITSREVRRIIGLYEKVFREFKVIE